MSEKVLLVDADARALRAAAAFLEPDFALATAASGPEALEACRLQGPFAVVVCDHDLPGFKGSELLKRVRQTWPETVAVMLSGAVDLDVALEALHAGRVFRFLEKPCTRARLREAVEAAAAEHRTRRDEHRRTEELAFASSVLARFNCQLDERLEEQARSLLGMHRFVCGLNGCESLEEVARLTASTCDQLFAGRGVRVELWNHGASARWAIYAGPPPGGRRHVQPVQSQEGQIGSIAIGMAGDTRRLAQSERSLLAAVASSAAVASYHLIRRAERDEAQDAAILALARLAEQRDNETGAHLERVSSYCRLIAEGLRQHGRADEVNEEFVRDLVRSAPLHDIGKVGIPDAILRKPGKLSAQEWEIMKTHTTIGARTLRGVISGKRRQRFLEMSLDIAWCHHEKWDGSGYPRGLAGEQIPLSARILAVADVYDALTTVRPYKQAWSHAESIAWIEKGAGEHFDPLLVRVLLEHEARADAIRRSLPDTPDDEALPLEPLAAGSAPAP